MTALDQQRGHLSIERGASRLGAGRGWSDGFPVLTIRGVRASRHSRGLNCYLIPSSPETVSKHRRRVAVRAALRLIVQSLASSRSRVVRM